MKCLIKNFHIKKIKQFNGEENYLNVTGYNNKLLIRKEKLVQNDGEGFILSSIVDCNDVDVLSSYIDPIHLNSYEDPRFINDTYFTYNLCYFDRSTEIMGAKMGYYNLKSNTEDLYNFAKWEYEKNWQVDNNKIVYSLEPLEIYSKNFKILKELPSNKRWNYWKSKYGIPRLSTNIFQIEDKYFTIFHSKIFKHRIKDYSPIKGLAGEQQYFCGLLEVTKDYIPIQYYTKPLFPSFNDYNKKLREDYVKWRSETNSTWIVDIVFPTNIEIIDNQINIYCGINDCIAAKIIIEIDQFINYTKNQNKIILN